MRIIKFDCRPFRPPILLNKRNFCQSQHIYQTIHALILQKKFAELIDYCFSLAFSNFRIFRKIFDIWVSAILNCHFDLLNAFWGKPAYFFILNTLQVWKVFSSHFNLLNVIFMKASIFFELSTLSLW